jgi:hypothetical protein
MRGASSTPVAARRANGGSTPGVIPRFRKLHSSKSTLELNKDRGVIVQKSNWLLILTLAGASLSACVEAQSRTSTSIPPTEITTVTVSPLQTASSPPLPIELPTPRETSGLPSKLPTPFRPPKPTATPDSRWKVNAIRLQFYEVGTIEWESDQLIQTVSEDGTEQLFDALTGQTISPTSIGRPASARPQVFSPDQQYFIECDEDATRLYRSADGQLITQDTFQLDYCTAEWSSTSQQVALASEAGLYLWYTDGRAANQVYTGYGRFLTWSPNGKRLLFTFITEDSVSYKEVVGIVNTAGALKQLRIRHEDLLDIMVVYWVNNRIVALESHGAYASEAIYLDVDTGRQFSSWFNIFEISQSPSFSPDGVWRVTENSYRLWTGEAFASKEYLSLKYEILNFRTGENYILTEATNRFIHWGGWSKNSRLFYFVHRPADATAVTSPDFPFGFMSLDPATREIQVLFEQAVVAKQSPDGARAWVIFPAKHNTGSLGFDAGIFDLSAQTLVGRQPVLDELVYQFSFNGELVPSAWSNNSRWFVWGDSHGNLTLIDAAQGLSRQIAVGLPTNTWPEGIKYVWSPNDQHLLVQAGNQRWIVDTSNLVEQ